MHDQIKQDGMRYNVEHYELHPRFLNYSVYDDYDMAMVTLVGRIQFNQNVHPICLTTVNDDYTGRIVTVSGKLIIKLKLIKNYLKKIRMG